MIGRIIEVEGKEGLFVVVDYQDNATDRDFQYVQDYYLIPYKMEMDELEVNLSDTELYKLRGLQNTITEHDEIKLYVKYGYSDIRGVKKVYLERIWEETILPGR